MTKVEICLLVLSIVCISLTDLAAQHSNFAADKSKVQVVFLSRTKLQIKNKDKNVTLRVKVSDLNQTYFDDHVPPGGLKTFFTDRDVKTKDLDFMKITYEYEFQTFVIEVNAIQRRLRVLEMAQEGSEWWDILSKISRRTLRSKYSLIIDGVKTLYDISVAGAARQESHQLIRRMETLLAYQNNREYYGVNETEVSLGKIAYGAWLLKRHSPILDLRVGLLRMYSASTRPDNVEGTGAFELWNRNNDLFPLRASIQIPISGESLSKRFGRMYLNLIYEQYSVEPDTTIFAGQFYLDNPSGNEAVLFNGDLRLEAKSYGLAVVLKSVGLAGYSDLEAGVMVSEAELFFEDTIIDSANAINSNRFDTINRRIGPYFNWSLGLFGVPALTKIGPYISVSWTGGKFNYKEDAELFLDGGNETPYELPKGIWNFIFGLNVSL